jgi:protein-export membrane protein SecD
MDDLCISYPTVSEDAGDLFTDGIAYISGNFDAESVKELANRINAGALPFKLNSENYNSISATLGSDALQAMVLAGAIAFVIVCIIMVVVFRLPGVVASIALLGQVAGSIAAISGFFPGVPSFTLTLPSIAGIILAIGMGVDANVITGERIREELANGRTLEKSIDIGFSKAFTAVLDGNITVLIVSIILMGAFGDPNTIFAWIFKPFASLFGASTSGVIYSFRYTLFVGVICNLVMGVGATRLMLKSISKFAPFRKLWMYGGKK